MTTTQDTMIEAAIKEAERIGKRHGENAAEYVAQYAWGGRHAGDSEAAAREFLRMAEEGDPVLWDSYNPPNLSGEYADDYSESRLLRDVLDGFDSDAADTLEPEVIDEIADAYNRASSDGFWQRLEESAANLLER